MSVAGGLLAVALLWFGVAMPLLMAADSASREAETAEEQLDRVRTLRARFDQVNQSLVSVETRILSGPTGEIFTDARVDGIAIRREDRLDGASHLPRQRRVSGDQGTGRPQG